MEQSPLNEMLDMLRSSVVEVARKISAPAFDLLNLIDGEGDDDHGRILLDPGRWAALPMEDGSFYLIQRHSMDLRTGQCAGTVICHLNPALCELINETLKMARDDSEIRKLRAEQPEVEHLDAEGEVRQTTYEILVEDIRREAEQNAGGRA